jgi:catechol 2,3-dioxygenase-like lactoylglutathione lyase family enzyme
MSIHGMNHFTVLSAALDQTRAFYCDVLGLEVGPRPPMSFPGLWLYADGRPVLHVMGGKPLPEPRNGVIDHMAFSASDLQSVVRKLQAQQIKFSLRRAASADFGAGDWQLFCRDPSGALVELDFAASETAPDDALEKA